MELLLKGGPLMWVLLGCSILGVAVIAERSIVYLTYGLASDRWLDRVLARIKTGQLGEAEELAARSRHPVARVVATYLENRTRPSNIRLNNIKRTGALALENVEKRLRILAAIAHLAPLIGLLGTVIGMVVAFSQIQALQGTVKPSDLAGGIWEALLTTVFGLAVAIPCMAAFHAFESHADTIARRMELAVTALDDVLAPPAARDEAAPAMRSRPAEDWSTVG
jgi:biopolymer transport protein ExbB